MRYNTFYFIALLLTTMIVSCEEVETDAVEKPMAEIQQIEEILNKISADSVESYVRTLAGFGTRHTASVTENDTFGIGAARRWIYSKFQQFSERSGGRLQVKYGSYTETGEPFEEPVEIVNVIAVLPGTPPALEERVYVVSGHYDSRASDAMNDTIRAPGAADDASGVAAVMEMARVMSDYKFDATIVFMAVAGEEQGLFGSTHYAEKAQQNNWNIAAMITNDIVGRPKGPNGEVDYGIRVFAQGIPPVDTLSRYQKLLLYTGGGNDTPPRQLARFIHNVAETYMPEFKVNIIYRKDRYLRGGDHSPFLARGYPAVRFTQPHEVYKHQHQNVRMEDGVQYGDLPKFLNYEYVADVARLNAATFAMIANAPARPDSVRMLVEELTNSTTLTWAPSEAPDLKGYEIVWRQTHDALWHHSVFAGDTTTYTVEGVSKDNYIFGVKAVDTAGYESPAVYPLPAF